MLASSAAGVVAVLILGLCLAGAMVRTPGPIAGSWQAGTTHAVGDLYEAANALAVLPAARYVGTSTTPDGARVTVDARVTNEGSTLAAVTVAGRPARVLAKGNRLFVRADAAFWRGYGAPAAEVGQYARAWVRVPSDAFGVDFAQFLAPSVIAEELDLAAWSGDVRLGEATTVDGAPARGLVTPKLTAYVSTTGPARVVRVTRTSGGYLATPEPFPTAALTGPQPQVVPVDGPEAPPVTSPGVPSRPDVEPVEAPGGDDFSLDLSGLPDEEIEALYREFLQRVNELRNSVDSQVRFSLAGNITLAPCSTRGCRANVTISNRVASGSPYLGVREPVRARITVSMTLDGRPIQNCVQERTMPANGSVSTQCFAAYYIPPSRNPRTHRVAAQMHAVALAVVDADIRRLAQDTLAERQRNRQNRHRTATP
ncbi:MAG TPA: hypothetical protein VGR21_07970, partial [Cryptosporangiaceae bacterium]|nr:hypothetical protein [Cryptosporangiaceae bacterium]